MQSPGQEGNVWRPNTIKYCLVTKHFTVWPPCLVLFHRVWSCLIKFEGHQAFDQKLKTILLFSCLMSNVLFVWPAAYQTRLMWACVPRLLSSLYQLFIYVDQTCFNRLATHFNISMFGHQTMLDDVWSLNISPLSRA